MSSLIWGLVFTVAYASGATTTEAIIAVDPPPIVWNPTVEEVKAEIRRVFPDAPIMLHIADCESDFFVRAHNTTMNKNGTTDGGVFQLNSIHDAALARLGLDKWNFKDNIAYARILYDANGLRDWNSSKHCWGKHLST